MEKEGLAQINWTHSSTINGFCLIVFVEERNIKHFLFCRFFQNSLVEQVFTLIFQKRKDFYQIGKNATREKATVKCKTFKLTHPSKRVIFTQTEHND